MRRAAEKKYVSGMTQIGIRNVSSTAKEGYIDAKQRGSKIFSVRHLRKMGIENLLKEIPKATFLGWPIIKSIGGKCVDDYLTKDEKYVISKEDRHPNAKGHELISEILYDKYNQNYS